MPKADSNPKRSFEPHPACLPEEDLLKGCEFERTKRGGPGGQHRNKTESAIVVTHRETGVIGQASERRSQHQNRDAAVARLRLNLALAIRVNRVNRLGEADAATMREASSAPDGSGSSGSECQTADTDGGDELNAGIESDPRAAVSEAFQVSPLWQKRVRAGKIQVSQQHADFPCVLAECLDWLTSSHFEIPPTAQILSVSNSQLVKFLKSFPPAWQLVQRERESRGMRKLR